MTASPQDEEDTSNGTTTIRFVSSIASGVVEDNTTTTPSLTDFNALVQQTQNMQERMDALEKVGLLQHIDKSDDEKDDPFMATKRNSLKEDVENANKSYTRRRTLGQEGEMTESAVEAKYDEYELPESTYSLLMTEKILSIPFFTGIVSVFLSLFALVLALKNELDNGEPGNFLGLPAGVQSEVRMAQYLGILIGVLMEDEIPTGLELIGKGVEQRVASASTSTRHMYAMNGFDMKRIVLPALLRLAVGYTFLCCLFLVVVQEQTVLDIFFDVLALEFIENIDDVIFAISKRGFFGRSLRLATNDLPCIETNSQSHTLRRWTKRFIRVVYLLNICIGIGSLTYLTLTQREGKYRCDSVTVSFGDDVLEEAYVKNADGEFEKRLLVFSHFNGIYKENGRANGRPKYTEMNKEDGDPFLETVPAEIIYCPQIETWVFQHQDIRTSPNEEEENDCSWLLRSPNTDSFDIIELAEEVEWFVWKGLVESEYRVSIECNECEVGQDETCNYNGVCVDESCDCNEDHFGTFCEFLRPCDVIRSEKDVSTELKLLGDPNDDEVDFVEVYGRPVYVLRNLSGKPTSLMRLGYPEDETDQYYNVEYPENSTEALPLHQHYNEQFFEDDDFFEINNQTEDFQKLMNNYTFALSFTGRRWYGKLISPDRYSGNFKEEEYHAFWDNAFSGLGDQDNSTLLISAPTTKGSPVGVDFYEMRRRNVAFETGVFDYDYSPFGVLIPLVEYEGSGFFHCNKPNV